MAITSIVQTAGQCLHIGLSSDTKPPATSGHSFIEADSGKVFQANGTIWVCTSNSTYAGLAHSHVESDVTSLASDLTAKVTANGAITGATKTKLTYDTKGLVTAGVDATTADVAASANKNYVTDLQLVAVQNLSGINTGDQVVITNASLATMATKTYKGRTSAGTGAPEDVAVATLKTDLVLVKGDVGLGSVDNTSDASKPISTATQTALDAKEASANKNAASGYAGLDGSSKLAGSQQVYGSASSTACQGNDARLSDARTPTAHATTHAPGGADPIRVYARAFALMGA